MDFSFLAASLSFNYDINMYFFSCQINSATDVAFTNVKTMQYENWTRQFTATYSVFECNKGVYFTDW